MKNLIVLCATLPLTLAIMLFMGLSTVKFDNENFVREQAEVMAQQASKTGYISQTMVNDLQTKISKKLDIEKDEILISSDGNLKYYSELISYKVVVPVKKVVPANRMFGISDENNTGKIIIENQIASEKLMP